MEARTPVFKRVPPGDRWTHFNESFVPPDFTIKEGQLFPTLTDALEYHFQKTGLRQYFIDAVAGIIYSIAEEPDPEPIIQTYSIYGDDL